MTQTPGPGTSDAPSKSSLGKDDPEKGVLGDDRSDVENYAADDSALGVGGTSLTNDDDQGQGSGIDTKTKMAVAGAAVPVLSAGAQLMILMMFLKWLKGLMMMMMALIMNLWNMFMMAALAAVKAVAGFFMGIGSAISGFFGGAISAVAAAGGSFVGGFVVLVVLVSSVVTGVGGGNSTAQRDDALVDCTVYANASLESIPGAGGDSDALTTENAQLIYGVFAAWGMSDENIAGIIGNWQAESSIDPTSVQGIFNAPQQMTEEKKAAATDTDNGIGLGQWTFGRNANLRTYAEAQSADWWALPTQLGFMISADEGGNADIVKGMISTSQGTPADAAIYFHDKWERSADTASMKERRAKYATAWMGLFAGWEKNQELANSILTQSGATVTAANDKAANEVRSDCREADEADTVLAPGGLTLVEAQALMNIYREEGAQFLTDRYGVGGPAACSGGKADNCVSFSTYFVNKYTSFQQYAPGNGIKTASSMALMMGKTTTKVPKPYSVASGPGSGPAGHTFVILGIEGDQAVIGEAGCDTNMAMTRARYMPLSQLTSGAYMFVDVSDLITTGANLAPINRDEGSTEAGMAAVSWARQQLGKPYVWGASGPSSFDCSGLTSQSWLNGGGITLWRTAESQYNTLPHVDKTAMQPGDLIFWGTSPSNVYHVAIYSGNGMMVEAPKPGAVVVEVPVRWDKTMPFSARP